MSCCIRDEGGPLGFAMQLEIPNHFEVLLSKVVVLSVKEKLNQ